MRGTGAGPGHERAVRAGGPGEEPAPARRTDCVIRRQPISEADLERQLLRRSVSSLHAERLNCDRCRRTPLVGEVVYRYARGRTLCALCTPSRRELPLASIPVRHGEEIRAQRLTRPAEGGLA